MMPLKDQKVQVMFSNGTLIEGFVINWSDQKSSIKLINKNEIIIIQKTLQDVLAVRIFLDDLNENKENKENIQPIKKKFDDLKNKLQKTKIDFETLASLKEELNNIEKQEISEKLNTHTPNNFKEVSYVLPGSNLKIAGAVKHTTKEIQRTMHSINSELQKLFGKENKKQ